MPSVCDLWSGLGGGGVLAVSPHLDDAVLSFGAALAQEAARRAVTVLTVFAGDPGPDLSSAAQRHHARCGLGADAVAVRRAEDQRALSVLGVRVRHAELADAVYRTRPGGGWVCESDADIFASPPDDPYLDSLVLGTVLDAIDATIPCLLLGPAGIGGHVDHILTRRAVLRAADARSLPVLLWRDVPYVATVPPTPEDGTIVHVPYTAVSLRAKLAAVGCYVSQLGMLWSTGQDWRIAVASLGAADGRPAGEIYHRRSPMVYTS